MGLRAEAVEWPKGGGAFEAGSSHRRAQVVLAAVEVRVLRVEPPLRLGQLALQTAGGALGVTPTLLLHLD